MPILQKSGKNVPYHVGFPGDSNGKEFVCSAGDPGSIPWLGRSPGEGNGHPLQYSRLGNPRDRGAWRATVCRVAKSRTRLKELSTHAPYHVKVLNKF